MMSVVTKNQQLTILEKLNRTVVKLDTEQWEKNPIVSYPARGQATRYLRYAVKLAKKSICGANLSGLSIGDLKTGLDSCI